MSFGGGGGGGALPNHEHTNIPLDGGPLDFVNTTVGSLSAGSITYSDGNALQELVIGAATNQLTVSGGLPAWVAPGAAAYSPGIDLLYRLPKESDTGTPALNDLFRIGTKEWKITQNAQPFIFEDNATGALTAVSDDMSGYPNDAAMDVNWVTAAGSTAGVVDPQAANDRVFVDIPAVACDAAVYYDIGHTLADDEYFYCSFTFQKIQAANQHLTCTIGLSNNTSRANASQNWIGIGRRDTIQRWRFWTTTGTLTDANGQNVMIPDDSNEHGCVIMGNGYGTFQCIIFKTADISPSNILTQVSINWNDAPNVPITGLRYFKITGFAWSTTGSPNLQQAISNFYVAESDAAELLQGVFNDIP